MTAAEKNFLCRRIVTAKFLPREVPRHRLDRRLFTGSKDLVAAIVMGQYQPVAGRLLVKRSRVFTTAANPSSAKYSAALSAPV
jgi:hypothetical protein